MTFPEPPENLPSDAALAELRTRLGYDDIPAGPIAGSPNLEDNERYRRMRERDQARIGDPDAKRDEPIDYDGRLAYFGDMSRRLLDEKQAAGRWAAWFAAEAAHWKTEADLYHTVAAQNYENDGITVASLDAERTELWARIAELEAAQGEPLGYAVAVDVDGGRIVQTSAVLPKSVAVARAENYRTEFGMTTSVVELREVSGE